jgi:hypothetical protein
MIIDLSLSLNPCWFEAAVDSIQLILWLVGRAWWKIPSVQEVTQPLDMLNPTRDLFLFLVINAANP